MKQFDNRARNGSVSLPTHDHLWRVNVNAGASTGKAPSRLRRNAGFLVAVSAALVSCTATPPSAVGTAATAGIESVDDLYIVDCLLPGQVRVLGGRTYQTPRRPTRTTAVDCRIRGGEYTAYDRADLRSALAVWMGAAETGDAEAQNTVGEIFERGLGDQPNYEAAAIWYEKAAAQGHSAALLNLGTLYERGLGVQTDRLKALNLYRQSWGLAEDDLMYESAVNRELETIRNELNRQIDEQRTQIELLERQIGQLRAAPQRSGEAERELEQLREWVARLRTEQAASEGRLARTREPSPQAEPNESWGNESGTNIGGKDFGRYYALVIGNQQYEMMEDLATPVSDARRVAAVLEQKYGFSVQLVTDANDLTVMTAMNNLRSVIRENDNLLIYYAGHGSRIRSGEYEIGYWLPTNAHRPPDDSLWIPTEQVTKVMATSNAQRVLVIADSCYAGLLTTDPAARFSLAGDPGVYRSPRFLESRFPRRSRLLISSGGDQPVLDDAGNGNSVFANAFVEILEANSDVLSTPALFLSVRQRVYDAAREQEFEEVPEINAIGKAGHESGDFFFIPSES